MANIAICVLIGLAGGFVSGLIGIGGGIIMVPAMIFLLKFPQHLAQGTSLALMLLPIGTLAVINYHKQGFVDWRVAAILIAGFVLGSWLGSRAALGISDQVLSKVFGVFLLAVSLKMIFFK